MTKFYFGINVFYKKQFCLWLGYNESGNRIDGQIHYITGSVYYFEGDKNSKEKLAGFNHFLKSNKKDII